MNASDYQDKYMVVNQAEFDDYIKIQQIATQEWFEVISNKGGKIHDPKSLKIIVPEAKSKLVKQISNELFSGIKSQNVKKQSQNNFIVSN